MSTSHGKGRMNECTIAAKIVYRLTLALGVENKGNNKAISESALNQNAVRRCISYP